MKKFLPLIYLFISILVKAQDTTGSFTFSAYGESYYTYDFNKPADNYRPSFIYSHNRHNEFNVNLAFVKAAYSADRVRANLALAAGTYVSTNYASEPGVLKSIFEANAGLRISDKNIWLDAGVFNSHIGFESAISKDCWNLTRSILAENSPYFEAGAKLTYTSNNDKWLFSLLALNGWQRITRVSGNSLISWGTQIQFRPTGSIYLNSSTFLGTDKPDSGSLGRFFHNFYGIFNVTDRFGIILGFDIGFEEKMPDRNGNNTWCSPVVMVKHAFNDIWTIAARIEYYRDVNGVIIATGTPNGFSTSGLSFNIDHSPSKNVLARLELRNFRSKDEIFYKGTGMSRKNTFITSSIAVSF